MDVLAGNNDRLLYELEQLLISQDARNYLHYFLRSMYPRIISGEIVLILAPIDAALNRLADRSGKSIEQIAMLPEGIDMLTNFLSSKSIQQVPPVFTAINGSYLSKQEDLNKLRGTAGVQLGNLFVATVDGIINMPGQLDKLKQANLANTIISPRSNIIGDNFVTGFDDFPNPIIRKIILELPLSDVVNTCKINEQFNSVICDNENFWNEKTRKNFPEQRVMINNSWKNTYQSLSRKLYTFGNGKFGQLGHGDNQNQDRPKLVGGLNNVSFVACAVGYTAVISANRLYTFGGNMFSDGRLGILGYGEPQYQFTPKLVEVLDNVTYVACGLNHTAIISNNQLYTFGIGYHGELGHGDHQNQLTPTLVAELDNVSMVACGNEYTAVISNGLLYTFGSGYYGRLGHGDERNQSRPKLVEGLGNVTFVACGMYHTAVIANGQLYTFGNGGSSRLGNNNFNNQSRPQLIEGLINVSMVACGAEHTAVIVDGQLYTFGAGGSGQLGHGDNYDQSIPKRVEGLNNVSFVSCRGYNTAIVGGGLLYTFGQGEYGQLGHDNKRNKNRPTLVEGLIDVTMVSCGGAHTAAIAN